ncbi:XRE family transcriptional regulator [Nocardiopsis gilva YIM 90087]|uniref:XRE family transcriptional regulator n=1 Tax=Nocardiopsis gilva YIM 90087 TaxID=1235441 RepID=A0A223S7M6_9ACTN|nr:helix-turn-helix transcriptional regulator [Nocardiopsis gilva]ASU84100.1 XRE family transcriptional regulator [Nocardiopsis gilva YIM 90087]
MPRNSPTAARRTLARFLRDRRREAGIPREKVGQYVGKNPVTITRLEKAEVRAEVGTVSMMLNLYKVPEEERAYFIDLARAARKRGWWQRYAKDIPSWLSTYIGLEADASEIRCYQVDHVPGLLQTEEYTRALLRGEPQPVDEGEARRRVEVHAARQRRLAEEATAVRMWAVIDESVLRRAVGGVEVMRGQLRRLLDDAQRPGVRLQVLPFASGAHPGSHGSFVTLKFPDPRDRELVYIEYRMGAAYLEEDEEVAVYDAAFAELGRQALSPSRSRALIGRLLDELAEPPAS